MTGNETASNTPDRTPRVLLVDDHVLLLEALSFTLAQRGITAAVSSGPAPVDVLDAARRFRPDAVLLDMVLTDRLGSGLDLVEPLLGVCDVVVLMTGVTDRLLLATAVERGAAGVISKSQSLDGLVDAIERVVEGRPLWRAGEREELLADLRAQRSALQRERRAFDRLTDHERHVLGELMDGCTAEQIAAAHNVSVTTVRTHIRSVLQKLGVHSQLAAVAYARRVGWSPDGPTAA